MSDAGTTVATPAGAGNDAPSTPATTPATPITGVEVGFTPGQTVVPPTPSFDVPEEYKDKFWAQNIMKTENPRLEFFKMMDGAQQKLGQRVEGQIPGKDATPEQVKAYYKQIGVPDDVTGYTVDPIEWAEEEKAIGDYIDSSISEPIMNDVKAAALASGMTPTQLKAVVDAYKRGTVKHQKEAIAKEQEQEVQFDTVATAMYGANKLTVLNNAKKILDASVPAQVKPYLAKLDNDALLVLAGALDGVSKRYIQEDGLGGKPTGSGAADEASIRAEGVKLMQHPAYRDVMHPEHGSIKRQVDANYDKLKNLHR